MVQPAAAVRIIGQRPAYRVHDAARTALLRADLPQFLDADAISLRIAAVTQVETREQVTRQRPAAAFGKHGLARAQFHAALKMGRGVAVLADAKVAGGNAAHRAGLIKQHLSGRKPRIDLDAEGLGLLAQPAADIAETHHIVAMVVHLRRGGQVDGTGGGQVHEAVIGGRGIERGAERAPVWQQFVERARLDHRARQDVRTHLRSLVHHADRQRLSGRFGQLAQADGAAQSRRAGPYDHHVVFHEFAFGRHCAPGSCCWQYSKMSP